ncbi:MAG: iron ABC transporter permease [Pseudomonadota bacterium]|nr:iron ABC transporter permease [Pseudomonadota bacterium]
MVEHGFLRRNFGHGVLFGVWACVTFVLALFLLGPFLSIVYVTTGDSGGLWGHLLDTVFPRYVTNTLVLMFGVSVLSLIFGLSSAWIVARIRFPGRRILEWMLILPATVPAYLIAYTYTDLLEFAGPVQGFLRDLFGWQTSKDYWFPEIRSMGGAILVMSAVLYPYIYLLARTAFRITPAALHEVARLHNRSSSISLDLALARPAIVAGLALVLMEVISDFGTVEYFAVQTLTLGIFNVWLGMNNLTAAAQIAGMSFIFIFALLFIEWKARSQQRFFDSGQRSNQIERTRVSRWKMVLCISACVVPILLGFIVPVGVLLKFVIDGFSVTDVNSLLSSALNSLSLSFMAAITVMLISLIMVVVVTHQNRRFLKVFTAISAMGYAFPGVVLAIGVVSFAGMLDAGSAAVINQVLGFKSSGILIGSFGLLVFAYVVRFQAIGYGSITAGINRLSPNLISANHSLGKIFTNSIFVLSPVLLKKSLLTGGLLVFVDAMKELPITLILRPFNFETLSTYVYQFAQDELLEDASLAGLAIVVVGLGPVLWMNASQRR